jgi:phosphohistidine phosphatase
MKLHLIRHGKAERSSSSGRDFDRQLASKGTAQSELLGEYLRSKGISEKIEVWCSDAARTRETLAGVRAAIQFTNVSYHEELYLCAVKTFLKMLWSSDSDQDLIIVGHNFGISDLAEYFSNEAIEMKTGEYVEITFTLKERKATSQGIGSITDRYRPSVDL